MSNYLQKIKRGKLVCQQLKNYDNTNKLNGSHRVRMKSSKTSCGMSTHAVFITVSQIPAQCAPNFLEVAVQTESTILQPSEPNLKVVNQQFQLVVALEKALLVVKPYRKVVSDIAANDDKIRCYTGLASHAVFHSLLECMQPKVEVAHSTHSEPEIGRKMKLTCEEQLVTVTVLIQLSLGLLTVDITQRLKVSPAMLFRVFSTRIRISAAALKVIFPWPSKQNV